MSRADRAEYMRNYQRQWVRARRAAFFAGKACVKCAATSDLQMDHIERVGKVAHQVWSWARERREAELAKCQVLCRACHLEKTVAENRTSPHGNRSRYERQGCRCDLCREWKRRKNQKRYFSLQG